MGTKTEENLKEAFLRRSFLHGIPAERTNIVVDHLIFSEVLQGFCIESRVDFLDLVGIMECLHAVIVLFRLRLFDHLRIHRLELMGLAIDGFLNVLFGRSDPF